MSEKLLINLWFYKKKFKFSTIKVGTVRFEKNEVKKFNKLADYFVLMRKKKINTSFYFNPIHKRHIEYFNNTKVLADEYDLSLSHGEDQNNNTIPERPICDQIGITIVDGSDDKIRFRSWLLKNKKI
jgi:hypothetical protein